MMNRNAQVTLEAAAVIALVAVAFIAMTGFFKGAVQGNWKTNADSFSEGQYNPDDPGQSNAVSSVTFKSPMLKIKIGTVEFGEFSEGEQILNPVNCGDSDGGGKKLGGWGQEGALIQR